MAATYVFPPQAPGLSESLFRQVIDATSVGILIAEHGAIVYANARCSEIFGRPIEKLAGMSLDQVLPPEQRRERSERTQHSIRPSELSTLHATFAIRPDGSIRDIEAQTTVQTIDGHKLAVVSILDVTERNRRVERSLDSLVAEWRGTFDAVNMPIVITRRDGAVIRLNRAACRLTGLPESELTGVNIGEIAPGEPWRTAAQMVRYISAERAGTSSETRDESGRTWDINIEYFSKTSDRAERYILVFWNITGTVELQESLRRSETMSAMGKIVAGVAHEVRNPLFGISATLDAFAEEMSRPGYEECAAALKGEVKRLTNLMQDLLEYGKPVALHIEKSDLHEVVDEVVRRHAQSQVKIQTSFSPGLPPLLMDRSRMCEVFDNLIENAEQHTPAGSVVRVISSVVEHGGRSWIECRIEDTGPGFNPEDLDRVFDPFFTRREGGTGLGLSIVQRIIHDHSGKVFAGNGESGAVVRILLPVAGMQD